MGGGLAQRSPDRRNPTTRLHVPVGMAVLLLVAALAGAAGAAAGDIATYAGTGVGGYSGDGGPATAAQVNWPEGVAVDEVGNLFIGDQANDRVRRVDAATGVITTYAGNGLYGDSGDGGPATAARLNGPGGLAVDGEGNLFIADQYNHKVRRVDAATGVITTYAGTGSSGYSGDGGPATAAQLYQPSDVAVDTAGNLFIADQHNDRVRRVDAITGVITTYAGTGDAGYLGDGGPATAARFDYPVSVAVDGAGNLFIADWNNSVVRRVDAATGVITTYAGTGSSGYSGDGGPATAAQVNWPIAVAVSGAGDLFIADTYNDRVRRVERPATVTVRKSASPADGTDFSFAGDLGSFTLDDSGGSDDGDGYGESVTRGLMPGTYSVSEVLPSGWELTSIVCDDGSPADIPSATATVTVTSGEAVECVFSNTEIAPAEFGKKSPDDGATGVANPVLSWYSRPGATRYIWCRDTSDNDTCDSSWGQTTATSVDLYYSEASTTYYWQVRADVPGEGLVGADGGTWWQYTTGPPPGPFQKASPADGATNVPFEPYGLLSWTAASGGDSYSYCIDTTDDDACSGAWSVGSSTSGPAHNLAPSTTYYWQAWVKGDVGTTYADGSETAFWEFTTADAFVKTTPLDGATGQPLDLTLSWSTSSGASRYSYCYDTTDDDACASWVNRGTATSVDLTGLWPDTTYYWQAKATNDDSGASYYADGASTAFWQFTTQEGPPGPFDKASPPRNSLHQSLQPTLEWTAAPRATSYYYCYDTSWDDACSTTWNWTAGTSVTLDTTLAVSTGYQWQVRAVNDAGITYADGGTWWGFVTGYRPAGFGKSSPINGATWQALQPTLAWEGASRATSYEYCYDTVDDGSCNTRWRSTTETSLALSRSLRPDTTYYWQVRAENEFGKRNADGGIWWSFTTGRRPSAFGKSMPTDGAMWQVLQPTMAWEVAPGATSYEYCYDTVDDDACNTVWSSTTDLSKTPDTALPKGTTYYWQVRAANDFGERTADGGIWWSFTTRSRPDAFGKSRPEDGSGDQTLLPTLRWSAAPGATSYEYCFDTTNDDRCTDWADVGTARGVWLSERLAKGTTYYWQVRAVNDLGARYANHGTYWSFTTAADSDGDGIEDLEEEWLANTFAPTYVFDEEEQLWVGDADGNLVPKRDFRRSDVTYLYQVSPGCQGFEVDHTIGDPEIDGTGMVSLTIVALYRYDYVPIQFAGYGKYWSHYGDSEALQLCFETVTAAKAEYEPWLHMTARYLRHSNGREVFYRHRWTILKRHNEQRWYRSWRYDYESGHHPRVYVAEGKHAAYMSPWECHNSSGESPTFAGLGYFEDCDGGERFTPALPAEHNVGEADRPLMDTFAVPGGRRPEAVWGRQQRFCGGYNVFSPDAVRTVFTVALFVKVPSPTCAGPIGDKWIGKPVERRIQVWTPDLEGAGTDANVYIDLYGTEGSARFVTLSSDTTDPFERGKRSVFDIHTMDLGHIESVCVYHDNSGDRPGWAVGWIRYSEWDPDLERWVAGKRFRFVKLGEEYQWLALDESPNRLWACRPTDRWPTGVWRPTEP